MSVLSAFNNVLDQFLAELVLTFPELQDLRTIQTLVGLIRGLNARLVLENFLSVAGRYHEKILTRDAGFFEDLGNWEADPYFQAEYAGAGGEDTTRVFQRLQVFRDVWVDLTERNRDTIWVYFRQLLVLGARANNNPQLAPLAQQILERARATAA